jgi:hypothetical protein
MDSPETTTIHDEPALDDNAVVHSLDSQTLIEIARRYEVPMPPADARLVLAHTESWGDLGIREAFGLHLPIYSPAYLMTDETNRRIQVLRGAEQETLEVIQDQESLWLPFSTEHMVPKPRGVLSDFSVLSAFLCAVQTAARGDEDTAQAIWRRFAAPKTWRREDLGNVPISSQIPNQRLLLGRCIFDHLRNSLLKSDVDRDAVYTRMTTLLNEFPQLNAAWRQELWKDLAMTVQAPPPVSGSVEQLLLDWASRPETWFFISRLDDHTAPADSPDRVILSRGHVAVPELIALLRDRRITAHVHPGINNAPARILRVGELAYELFGRIAGDEELFPQRLDDTAAILAWWETTRERRESYGLGKGVLMEQPVKPVK